MEEELDDESQEIGEEPPEVTIGSLIATFQQRGFKKTMDDENLGPYTHLFVLLCIVFLISIIIGIYMAVA